jgi:hypothetical protein
MKKISLFLVILIFIGGCEQSNLPEEPKKSVCGDNICDISEKESCAKDCGGVAGITKQQCEQAGGKWNDCGSACAGTGAEICIQVCSPQCECGGLAGFTCPKGFKCRLSGKIADEIGVCIKS